MQLKRFIQDSFWVLVGEGLQKFAKLIMAYFVARYLSTEEYGQYNYIFSLLTLLSIFGLPTSSNAIIRAAAQGRYGTFEYLLRLSYKCSFIGVGIFLGYGLFEFGVRDNSELLWLCLVSAVMFPLFATQEHWSAFLNGEGDFRWSSLLVSLRMGISTALQIFVMVFWWDESRVLAFTAAMLLVFAGFNYVMSRRMIATAQKRAGGVLDNVKNYVISTSKVESLNLFGNVYDKLLVFNFFSPTDLAILAIAERLPEIAKSFIKSLSNILVRMFSKENSISAAINLAIYIASALSFLGLLVVCLFLVPPVMNLLFTIKYHESIFYTQILLVTIPLTVISSAKFAFIKSKGDARALNSVTQWMSIVRIVLSTILVPTLGVIGAVISTVGYRFFMLLIVHKQLASTVSKEGK
jgi:O-antigen/teichoic acid export membrane protein